MCALPLFHDEQSICMYLDSICDDGQNGHLNDWSVPIVILTWRKENLFQ